MSKLSHRDLESPHAATASSAASLFFSSALFSVSFFVNADLSGALSAVSFTSNGFLLPEESELGSTRSTRRHPGAAHGVVCHGEERLIEDVAHVISGP